MSLIARDQLWTFAFCYISLSEVENAAHIYASGLIEYSQQLHAVNSLECGFNLIKDEGFERQIYVFRISRLSSITERSGICSAEAAGEGWVGHLCWEGGGRSRIEVSCPALSLRRNSRRPLQLFQFPAQLDFHQLRARGEFNSRHIARTLHVFLLLESQFRTRRRVQQL